jgi:micrococcal nuclease
MRNVVPARRRVRRRRTRGPVMLTLVILATALAALTLWRAPEAGVQGGDVHEPVGAGIAPAARDLIASRSGVDLHEALAGPRELAAPEMDSVRFARCGNGARHNCVVDGDTFWLGGEKIRIADINTPEVSEPECAREARLGEAASARLLALLNEGAFTLESEGRDRDRYGRLLRVVERDGESLGAVLVREGLAEEWQGRRGGWC